MSEESKLQPYHKHTRRHVSEGPHSSQEGTLAVLLEQAFRIKEEVAAGLQSTQGSIQVEALSRKLLENHILTITRIVKQLSVDIQALQRQIIQRDSITSGTTMAVESLDQKNMAFIGDLRGRVARCDASIAKLSAGESSGGLQLIGLQQEVAELRSAVDARLKELEVKLYYDLGRLEASLSELSQGQSSSMSELNAQVQLLEARMSGGLKEAKEQTESLRKWTEQQITSSVQRCTQQRDKMLEAASRLADRLGALEARLEQFETQLDRAGRSQADELKRSETKLSKRITSAQSSLDQELQLLKQDYHKERLRKRQAEEEGDLEMLENVNNPLQCRVRLYEFYLSRPRESVKKRTVAFYLQPEQIVHTHSSHWYTSHPLEATTLQSMLTGILAVKECNQEQRAAQRQPSATADNSLQ